MAPVKLPQFVMFDSDNDSYLCLHEYKMGHPYLSFNCKVRNLWGAHEVIPVEHSIENVVMIKSMYNHHFWRRCPSSWIYADRNDKPSIDNLDCLFQVVDIGKTQSGVHKVALLCLASYRYVKRLTKDGIENCLSAAATDYNTDVTAQLRVTEAVSFRRMYDVNYLFDRLQLSSKKIECLGQNTATNNSSYKTDLSVTVEFSTESKNTWRNSSTVTTGLTVEVSAGIPDILDYSVSASTETSKTIEFGKEVAEAGRQSGTFTIKDVAPGDTVRIKVLGTRAVGSLPFKYKYQDTRVDGLMMKEETAEDGVFSGIQVTNTTWEATDSRGDPKQVIPIKIVSLD